MFRILGIGDLQACEARETREWLQLQLTVIYIVRFPIRQQRRQQMASGKALLSTGAHALSNVQSAWP